MGTVRTWFFVHLLLTERVLCFRSRRAGDQGDEEGLLANSGGDENDAPAKGRRGQCDAFKADKCTHLLCKHKQHRSHAAWLMQESKAKQESRIEVRTMPASERQNYLEGTFLKQFGAKRELYKTITYALKGETKKCSWATEALGEFEEWLQVLLPVRHSCVQKVVDDHGRERRTCSEGFTNEFKWDLAIACKDSEFPDLMNAKGDENMLQSLRSKFTDPHRLHDAGVEAAVTTAVVLPIGVTANVILAAAAGGVTAAAFGSLAALFGGLLAMAIAYLVCKYKGKKKTEGYHQTKLRLE